MQYCHLNKIIPLRLPPHSTHLLQPLDVVIFQQWKHWHAESIDHHIQHGVGVFNRHTFLSNLEEIRSLTLTFNNIQSVFHRCGYIFFYSYQVLQQIPEILKESDQQNENDDENENELDEI